MDTLEGLKRTHHGCDLSKENLGEEVVLMGWVQKRRDHGGLIFVDLRDRSGIVQIVFDPEIGAENFAKAEKVRSEYVLAIKGEVIARTEENINPNIETGEIEVKAADLRILNVAKTPPFSIKDNVDVDENVRLKYRYIDLRRPEMQKTFLLRHKITMAMRNYLDGQGFIDIETPMLSKSSPEGARDYLVPSRVHPGEFYALPQSPQLFKQMLMVSGMERYYQIVRCFRDEDLRADRQPEFTQLDMELSFVEIEDVLEMAEKMMAYVFKESLGRDIKLPLPRMTWHEAMERFGSDKPDMRFGIELKDISDIAKSSDFKVFASIVNKGGQVKGINAKNCLHFSRKEIDDLTDYVAVYGAKGLAYIQVTEDGLKSPIAKFFTDEELEQITTKLEAEPGDILFFVADKPAVVAESLGHLRIKIAQKEGLIDEDELNFLWVTEFPLFEYDEDDKRWVAMHHPFTSPMDEDFDLLETDPGKARAKAYDMVLNGVELGGGSIRIHLREIQERMFELLGLTKEEAKEKFGYLMEAFEYGAPPHGGIAFGLDRMVMLMAKRKSIRDVIAFPKTQSATCLMTEAPSEVSLEQLRELHIRTSIPKSKQNKNDKK